MSAHVLMNLSDELKKNDKELGFEVSLDFISPEMHYKEELT